MAWKSKFETFFLTSAMSSRAFCVRPFSHANEARPMMPVVRPKAVQFMASEIPFESSVAFAYLNGKTQNALDDIAEVKKNVSNLLYQAKAALHG